MRQTTLKHKKLEFRYIFVHPGLTPRLTAPSQERGVHNYFIMCGPPSYEGGINPECTNSKAEEIMILSQQKRIDSAHQNNSTRWSI